MTDLLYLDYNCFQRGFDDITQTRIKIEAIACQEISLVTTILFPSKNSKYIVIGIEIMSFHSILQNNYD
jgi:hypothetical protein